MVELIAKVVLAFVLSPGSDDTIGEINKMQVHQRREKYTVMVYERQREDGCVGQSRY